MAALAGGASFSTVRNGFAYSLEFQDNVVRLCPGTSSSTSTSANLKYVLTDVQGSGRALMNNSGSGTSTIVARHDYLPFGEEIWAGVGLRSTTQKYATTDKARQSFALTERDEATGLDHTWFRKYESYAGRWTSPDPYSGSIADPQTLNRYPYVANDPVNFIDPSGLRPCVPGTMDASCDTSGFGGWGWGDISGGNRSFRPGLLTILLRERSFDSRLLSRFFESLLYPWASEFIANPFSGYDPQNTGQQDNNPCHEEGAYEELKGVAKALGGKITETQPGKPTSTSLITGFKRNQQSFESVTERLTKNGYTAYYNPNPPHWFGLDFKGQGTNGRWFHVTVDYPFIPNAAVNSNQPRLPSGNDSRNSNTSYPTSWSGRPYDPSGRPNRITIHCDWGDPGSIFHG